MRIMKKIFIYLVLSFIFISVITGLILAQEVVMEHNEKLSEDQRKLWIAYGINPNQLEGVWVHSFKGTPEEAIKFIGDIAEKNGAELPEMHKFESTLGDTINNTISVYGERLVEEFGQEWLDSAEKKAVELNDVSQISYMGGFEIEDGTKVQMNIETPYLNPLTMEVYEGTYVIQTEIKDETEAAEAGETFGEKISLDSELPVEYFKGEWTLRVSDPDRDKHIPQTTIIINDYIGSIEETEIEAERFLFSGEIIIEDKVYEAFADIDNQENMYAYPISLISILKEEGLEPEFEIWIDDIDQDLSFGVSSDYKWVYENALGVNLNYDINGDSYMTDDDKIDYIMRSK